MLLKKTKIMIFLILILLLLLVIFIDNNKNNEILRKKIRYNTLEYFNTNYKIPIYQINKLFDFSPHYSDFNKKRGLFIAKVYRNEDNKINKFNLPIFHMLYRYRFFNDKMITYMSFKEFIEKQNEFIRCCEL